MGMKPHDDVKPPDMLGELDDLAREINEVCTLVPRSMMRQYSLKVCRTEADRRVCWNPTHVLIDIPSATRPCQVFELRFLFTTRTRIARASRKSGLGAWA